MYAFYMHQQVVRMITIEVAKTTAVTLGSAKTDTVSKSGKSTVMTRLRGHVT